ncbi:MAG: cytochrome c [Bacteroidetes bacterium]|nr:cytochrome c [Bacteroidota bacterium]
MSLRRVNAVLLVFLILLIGTVVLVRREYPTPNIQVLPGMVTSVAYGSQSANPNYPDGKTLQRTMEGTVVRGFEPLPYPATPEGALRAGEELRSRLNPSDSTADGRRGAFVFSTMCRPCHGAGGRGDGFISQRGFPPPPSFFADNAMNMKDGRIYHIITNGQGNMPSFATQVTRNDRWRVIAYIRSVQARFTTSTVAEK